MHSVSTALTDTLKQSVAVNSSARIKFDWNYNRFAVVQSVVNGTNPVASEFDNDLFPIASIVEPQRPNKGIVKAIVGEATTVGSYQDIAGSTRYVTCSKDDLYKYWTSPGTSAASSPFAITNVQPTVIYTTSVLTNRIRIGFENSNATATTYTVETTVDGTNWVTVANNIAPDSRGVVSLYRQAGGTWTTTESLDNPTSLRGVRLTVSNLSAGSKRFNLISLGLHLRTDVSAYVKEWSTSHTMSETSFIAPIGRASSNEGSISLDNTGLLFTDDNPSSPYFGLLDKNVTAIIDVAINKGTIASPDLEYIRQFTGIVTVRSGQTIEGTTATLSDESEYLQSVNPLPVLFQQMSAAEIIWRLLDGVGFSNWNYQASSIDPTVLVPAFWADGKATVWEVIAEIAEVTQTAVFFDEYGVLQIMPRSKAYDIAASAVWQFDGVVNGTKLPDIISVEKEYDFEANTVDIEYTPTEQSEETLSGLTPMEIVWQPEDTVTLRSTNLVKNMAANATDFFITPTDASVWPYTAVIQVEGEFIRYDAKEYSYYDAAGVVQKAFIVSDDEKKPLDRLNDTKSYANKFTGRMRIKERAMWGSQARLHDITYSNWTSKRYRTGLGTVRSFSGGFVPNPNDSTVTLKTNAGFTPSSWFVCTMQFADFLFQPKFYGARLKFDNSGYGFGAAGITIGTGNNDSGYFVELQRTVTVTTALREKYNNEVWICYRDLDGNITRLGKGAAMNIAAGVWYDIDVQLTENGTSRRFDVLVNGVPTLSATHTASIPAYNKTARCGIFARGDTSVQFEYFYNSTEPDNPSFDSATYWDRIKGGWQSNQYDSEFSYGRYNQYNITGHPSINTPVRSSLRFMDDFGPIVHEVREFSVDFATAPVTNSMIYFSNDAQVMCPEYSSSAFGATFILANMSRDNAVVNGDDTLTFGADNSVDQKLVIYGRNFISEDTRTYTVKDDVGIKRRGKVTTTVSSPWIQSEAAAKKLGEWITYHWAGGADQVSIESFGNPVLQVADIVSVNAPRYNMAPETHLYFVVGISQTYQNGLKTTYTLRRRKI